LVAVHPGASRLQAATKRFHSLEGGNAPVRSSFDLTSTAATGAPHPEHRTKEANT
jgi:hypothetical protein